MNELETPGTLIVAGRQPLSIANFTRLAKYSTDIKSLTDSELRSHCHYFATPPHWRK
jgi:hypothetical protein